MHRTTRSETTPAQEPEEPRPPGPDVSVAEQLSCRVLTGRCCNRTATSPETHAEGTTGNSSPVSHLCTLTSLFQAAWQAELQCHTLHNTTQARGFLYGFFPSSLLPTSHYGQHGTFRADASVLAFPPRFSALRVPWDLLRADIAQLVQPPNSHQSNTATSSFKEVLQGSWQKPCALQIFALQLAKHREKELWTACTSLYTSALGMQAPHKFQRDAFSRGNSNTDRSRDRCSRGGRRWLLHAGLHVCVPGCAALMGEFPWPPLQRICPIYLGFSVVVFLLQGFHCSPGAGRVSRRALCNGGGAA